MRYFADFRVAVAVMIVCVITASCNRNQVASPEGELLYPQPVTKALVFTDPVKLDFSQPARPYTPVINKVDFKTLPTSLFDSSDFKPFPTDPAETNFDPATLKDTVFNYAKLPSIPLKFKTSLLPVPIITKLGSLQISAAGKRPVFSIAEVIGGAGVSGILKTRDGMLWIGNEKGLYKYDGKYLSHFAINGFSGAVVSMTEDLDGKIWISSFGASGVFCVDIRSGILQQLTRAQGMLANFIVATVCDRLNRIWLTCIPEDKNVLEQKVNGGGVVIVDQAASILKYLTSANGLSNDLAIGMGISGDSNVVWVAAPHGSLHRIDLQQNKITHYTSREGYAINIPISVFEDRQQKIWVSGYFGEIAMVDPAQHLTKNFGEAQGFTRSFASALKEDWQGNLYIGTANDLQIINQSRNKLTKISKADGLSGIGNNAVETDNLGQVWIGSDNGINMIGRNGYNMRRFGKDSISSMIEDSRQRVWIGTLTQGVKIIDSNGIVKQFSTAQGLSSNFVQNMVETDGRMIISTNIGGLDMYDSSLTSTEHIGIAEGLNTDRITAILPHSSGKIWLGGYKNNGVDILDLNQRNILHIGTEQGLKDSTVLDLREDKSGNVWTSSGNTGIGLINVAAASIMHIKSPALPALTTGLANTILFRDSRDNMWVGSGDGLYMINTKRDSVTLISKQEGMLSNKVISLKEYHNHIYVGTSRGLQVIIPPAFSANHQWQIIGLDRNQGLTKVLTTYQSDLITHKGEYWWGDLGGTIVSNLDSLESKYSRPATFITGVSVLNQPLYFTNKSWPALTGNDTIYSAIGDTFYTKRNYDKAFDIKGATWDSVAGAYNLPVNLDLSYTHNYLQFQYGQAGMGSEDTTWYRYMLEGVDKDWSDKTTSPSSMNYLNLSPGNYTFKVVSAFKNTWGGPVSFSFSILPPWWKTWWAYCVYALLIVITLRTIIRFRSRLLKEDNQRLEKTVADRTEALRKSIKDLEDTQSQLVQSEKMASLGELTAGIAHEIQNPLNFVNNFSEVSNELIDEMIAELKNNNTGEAVQIAEDVKQNLEKILHHGKRADGIVKGMLQHSRAGGGSKEPTNINALTDEYLRLAYHGLRAKDKSFNATLKTDFDQTIQPVNIVPQDIGRVVLNLITNAFYAVSERKKQTPEGFDPTVTVSTKQLPEKIEIAVTDNGNGVPQKVLDKIFQPFFTTKPTGQGTGLGLSMSYDIVKAHGGELKVDTKEGQGASFKIELPL